MIAIVLHFVRIMLLRWVEGRLGTENHPINIGKRKPISYGLNSVIVRLEMQVTVRGMGWGSIFEKAIEFRVLGRHNGAWNLFHVPTPLNIWFRLHSSFWDFLDEFSYDFFYDCNPPPLCEGYALKIGGRTIMKWEWSDSRWKEETHFVRIELGDCSSWNASNRPRHGLGLDIR